MHVTAPDRKHAGPEAGTHGERDEVGRQISPRSFADATGDGIGDLVGITECLPQFADRVIDAIRLSPFSTSPMNDGGYSAADFCRDPAMMGHALDDPRPDPARAVRVPRSSSPLMLAVPGAAHLFRRAELGQPVVIDVLGDRRADPGRQNSGDAFGFGATGRAWPPQRSAFGIERRGLSNTGPTRTRLGGSDAAE